MLSTIPNGNLNKGADTFTVLWISWAKYSHRSLIADFVGHANLRHCPTESCLLWKLLLCALFFIHLYTIDNPQWTFFCPQNFDFFYRFTGVPAKRSWFMSQSIIRFNTKELFCLHVCCSLTDKTLPQSCPAGLCWGISARLPSGTQSMTILLWDCRGDGKVGEGEDEMM